jgi:hypothetical protein
MSGTQTPQEIADLALDSFAWEFTSNRKSAGNRILAGYGKDHKSASSALRSTAQSLASFEREGLKESENDSLIVNFIIHTYTSAGLLAKQFENQAKPTPEATSATLEAPEAPAKPKAPKKSKTSPALANMIDPSLTISPETMKLLREFAKTLTAGE